MSARGLAERMTETITQEAIERLSLLAAAGSASTSRGRTGRELDELLGLWRRVLDLHGPDRSGRCRSCHGAWGRRPRHPCRVWWAAMRPLVQWERLL